MPADAVFDVLAPHLSRVATVLTLKPGDSVPAQPGPIDGGTGIRWEFRYGLLARPGGDGARFCDAVRADEALRRMFPEASGSLFEDRGAWLTSDGSGGVRQLVLWPGDILAAVETVARITERVSSDDLRHHLLTVLSWCREAACGSEVRVPAAIALYGVTIEDGVSIQLPWATLRAWRPEDEALAGDHFGFARTLPFQRRGRVCATLLHTTVPISIELRPLRDWADHSSPTWNGRSQDWLDDMTTRTTLALMLASPTCPPVAAVDAWRVTANPFTTSGQTLEGRSAVSSPLPRVRLDRTDVERVEGWGRVVAGVNLSPLRVCLHRLERCITDSQAADEAFVDACIALESLLGSGGETTHRLGESLALLLEKDAAPRRALYARVKRLYGERSKLVHGSRLPDGDEVARWRRDETTEYVLRCLRELMSNRQALLPLTSDERQLRIVMDS